MKKITFFLILGIFCFKAQSQVIEISGSLNDSLNQTGLAYGNIIVKNQKDSIITSALTNDKGEFKIKNLAYKKGMYVQTNYVGYNDKRIDFVADNNKKINLGDIYVSQSTTHIKEATVVGKSKYMEQKFDRKVFNISETKTTAAKDIFDLLKTLPGVTVDQNENITYKGAPATIYVDDQPAEYVYPKTSMIPVASVLKIELIDASLRSGTGKGGIINIKMKNLATDGFSGVAQADNGTISFKDLNNSEDYINANYKIKKLIIFDNFNYNHTYSNSSSTTDGTLNYLSNNFSLNNKESDNNTNLDMMNYGGIRYSPDQDTRFRLSGGYYEYKGKYPFDGFSQQNDSANNILEEYNHNSFSDYAYMGTWINGSFYHKFDTIGKEMSAWYGWQGQKNYDNDKYTYNYEYNLGNPSDSTFNYKTNMNERRPLVYAGLYYNNPINNKTRWNCSWNGYYSYQGKESNIYSLNETEYYPLSIYNKFKQMSQTASFRIGTTLKKWKLDGGISAQYDYNNIAFTRYNVNSEDTLLNYNKGFLKWLPSATVVFSPDSLEEIKFTYDKSDQAPWYSQLCDFIDETNPYNWSDGNSNLVPTVYNNLYLGYAYNKDTWNINTDVFYSMTNNDVSDLTVPITDIITITKPENIAHNNSLGIELASWISIKQKYDFNMSAAVNHTSISATDMNGMNIKKNDFGYTFKFNADIHISKKTTGTFYINYFSREIIFTGYNFNYINSSISINHKFFDNKLLLTVGANNLFDNLLKHGDYTNYGGIIQTTNKYSSSYQPMYFITLQYKFRQGDRGTKDAGKAMKTGK